MLLFVRIFKACKRLMILLPRFLFFIHTRRISRRDFRNLFEDLHLLFMIETHIFI